MEQILQINKINVDIDNQTAIGIELKAYDIKNPAQRYANVSNDFTIPKTVNNLNAIGYLGELQNYSDALYKKHKCNYSIDNYPLIINGKCNIVEIGERIKLSMQNRSDIWDICKTTLFNDFLTDYIKVMNLPNAETPSVYNDLADFINQYNSTNLDIASKDKTIIPTPAYNNINKFLDLERLSNSMMIAYNDDGSVIQGGLFSIFYSSIFRYLEIKYNMSFNTAGIEAGNIFNDIIGNRAAVMARAITLTKSAGGYYYYNVASSCNYAPYDFILPQAGLTLFDIIDVFLKQLNVIIEDNSIGDYTNLTLYRFDDLENAEKSDLSDKLDGEYTIKPTFAGLSQVNKMNFQKSFEGADEMYSGRYIFCLNENIDSEAKELMKVKSFAPGTRSFITEQVKIKRSPYVRNGSMIIKKSWSILTIDMSHEDSFKLPALIVFGGQVGSYYFTASNLTPTQPLCENIYTPITYPLDNAYKYLQDIVLKPIVINCKMRLNLTDLIGLKFFKKYFIKEFGGYFFINKLSNINPKSNDSISVELIKLP